MSLAIVHVLCNSSSGLAYGVNGNINSYRARNKLVKTPRNLHVPSVQSMIYDGLKRPWISSFS